MSTETENSTIEKVEEVEEVTMALAGDLLREQREKLGISQKEIADRLRLRLTIIESIDKNNYDFDHVATFTRGYLRSYAKAVSLDEKVVLAALNHVNEVQHTDHEMQSFSRKTKHEKHDSRLMKLTWVIFAVIIGISSIWWYQNQQDTLNDAVDSSNLILDDSVMNEPASPVVNREPVLTEETVQQEVLAEPETLPEVEEVESVIEAIEPPEEAQSIVEEPTAMLDVPEKIEKSSIDDGISELSMRFTSDCWIQVKDSTGATLATGVKNAGREFNLAGEAPFNIILGAPEGVSITLAGEPVDLSGYTSGKVARFTLP